MIICINWFANVKQLKAGINPSWLWWINVFIYYWIQCPNPTFRIYIIYETKFQSNSFPLQHLHYQVMVSILCYASLIKWNYGLFHFPLILCKRLFKNRIIQFFTCWVEPASKTLRPEVFSKRINNTGFFNRYRSNTVTPSWFSVDVMFL